MPTGRRSFRAKTHLSGYALACMLVAFGTPAHAFNPSDTSVQMFRWRWNDIAKECTHWLGPQGYGAVQISPPHAAANLGFWYDVYQPVSFTDLKSAMGTEAELQNMVKTCHAAGVRVDSAAPKATPAPNSGQNRSGHGEPAGKAARAMTGKNVAVTM